MVLIRLEELAKEFQSQFECLGENTKKVYNIFSAN